MADTDHEHSAEAVLSGIFSHPNIFLNRYILALILERPRGLPFHGPQSLLSQPPSDEAVRLASFLNEAGRFRT